VRLKPGLSKSRTGFWRVL